LGNRVREGNGLNWCVDSLGCVEMTDTDLRRKIYQVCKSHGVRRLDLFGSRARSPERQGRDYDFVATLGDFPPEEYSKRFFGLLHGLEDSLGAPVDLLTPESIHKQSLKGKIEKEKICVYESSDSRVA
jgi:uncharacterized protein